MPYVKLNDEYGKMRRLLRGYRLNGEALAKVLQCSPATARTRLDNPGKLTLEELMLIHRRAHIPLEELRGALAE